MGKKNIPLSGDAKEVDEVWDMWCQYKEECQQNLNISITNVNAMKELLMRHRNAKVRDEADAEVVSESEDSLPSDAPQIKIELQETNKISVEDCVGQRFFLGTYNNVNELVSVVHNHAHVCAGNPKANPTSNRTFTSGELLFSCNTCGLCVLWRSSPMVGTHSLSDHRVGVGLHLAGITPAKVDRFLLSLGIERWVPEAQSRSDTILGDVVQELVENSCNSALDLEDKSIVLSFDARYAQRTDSNHSTVLFVSPWTHKVCVVVNVSKDDDK